MNGKVSIVIVNWNGLGYLENCLRSALDQSYANYQIILVDNGSTDGSLELLRKYQAKIQVITLPRNTGFAEGNNIGITESFKDPAVKYICTLNNDTIVEPGFVTELVRVMESDSRIGSVQPKLVFPDGRIQSTGLLLKKDFFGVDGISRGFNQPDTGQFDAVEEIFAPTAAAALYRRNMLEQIGLFDEDFFSYAEDLDLGLRSRLYGWTSFFCPGTKVIHLHSQSTGAASSFKAYYVKRNINFVAIKNLPIALLGRFVLYSCLNNIRILLKIRRRNSSINQLSQRITPIGLIGLFFKIFIDTAKHIPKMLRKRRAILPHRAISDRDLSMLFATFGS